MNYNVQLDQGALMPTTAHDADAGYDIRTPVTFAIGAGASIVIETGVHIQIPKGYVGMIKSKSGLNVNYGIISEGVVDSGYTGEIKVKLYNLSNQTRYFMRGDKITQIVFIPHEKPELIEVSRLEDTERGNGGFGSTGR